MSRAGALRGFLTATPPGRFVIVDMDYGVGEWPRWDGYWGVPFIWTKLHEFGGTDGIKGNLTAVRSLFMPPQAPADGHNDPSPSSTLAPPPSMLGTGFTDEGIDQNPAYYESLFDTAWRAVGRGRVCR